MHIKTFFTNKIQTFWIDFHQIIFQFEAIIHVIKQIFTTPSKLILDIFEHYKFAPGAMVFFPFS